MKVLRKKLKKIHESTPWLEHITIDERLARELAPQVKDFSIRFGERTVCLYCRGGSLLCGKPRCPVILRLYSFMKIKNLVSSKVMLGSSPPAVFVGRIGYPFVYAGPLIPPFLGDTSLLDTPEEWIKKTFDEIVNFRTGLVRGEFIVNVKKPHNNQHFLNKTLEIALSREPVDTEAVFKRKPSGSFLFDDGVQPMGPSAPLLKISIEDAKVDHRVEKVHNDYDLKAEEAILNLYFSGVPVSVIQRTFCVGALGVKKQRRLVPTRWSITAVDSLISRRLIDDKVKNNPEIGEYRIYSFSYLGNRFLIILTPSKWRYEWIEAWYPGTVWNPKGGGVAIGSDWEGYRGRTTYASLGGCYYAVRLAAAEFLAREGRQAGVIAIREVHPEYIAPLGVWVNRECVREAFRHKPEKFSTLKEVLEYASLKLSVPIGNLINISYLLKNEIFQEKITKYILC